MSSTNIPVNEASCSQACSDYVKSLIEKIETLRSEVEDLRYEGYQLRKGQKPLKAQLESKIKDFRRLQEDYSNKWENYDYVVKQNAELMDEIEYLKGQFETADFDFRKYDVSSEVVANMIDHYIVRGSFPHIINKSFF